jgi:hypothetical protein
MCRPTDFPPVHDLEIAPMLPHLRRTVTLYGTLTGPIWQPGVDGQLPVVVDLVERALRFVDATGSGLVDAIRATVDDAGDFRLAKLTMGG